MDQRHVATAGVGKLPIAKIGRSSLGFSSSSAARWTGRSIVTLRQGRPDSKCQGKTNGRGQWSGIPSVSTPGAMNESVP